MEAKEKNPRLFVIADKLDKEIRTSYYMKILNLIGYLILCIAIVILSLRGQVIVVGENFIGPGKGDLTHSSEEVKEIKAAGHSELLYNRFFSYDFNTIVENKNLSLYLGSALKEVYKILSENGFYKNVLDNHYVVRSFLDSTAYKGSSGNKSFMECYGRMELQNEAFLEKRKLNLKLYLSEVTPVKNKNPFGLNIYKLELLANDVIQEENK